MLLALGLLWLGSLGVAIFLIYRAHGGNEVAGYVALFAFILVALGAAFLGLVNRLYDWWLGTRVSSLVDNAVDSYQSEVHLELSDSFKEQLRSSPTFKATAIEATKLLGEAAAFSAVPHTKEESDAFQVAWHDKAEKLAERVARGDPLAVEVILKAIQKESARIPAPR